MMRALVAVLLAVSTFIAVAQRIDSVRIFRTSPPVSYTTAGAEAAAWHHLKSRTPSVAVPAEYLDGLNDALRSARPRKHDPRKLPGTIHVGFAYVGRAPYAFCLLDDLSGAIDLTNRREFPIEDLSKRILLRLALLELRP